MSESDIYFYDYKDERVYTVNVLGYTYIFLNKRVVDKLPETTEEEKNHKKKMQKILDSEYYYVCPRVTENSETYCKVYVISPSDAAEILKNRLMIV